ncbi:MAG: hypothetical protein J5589_02475 [Firmicutes bacterium]|nr:hypothetical protein [Bacillota bacterium]
MKGWKLQAGTEKILSLVVFGILIIAGVGLLVLIMQDKKVLAMEEESSVVLEMNMEESSPAESRKGSDQESSEHIDSVSEQSSKAESLEKSERPDESKNDSEKKDESSEESSDDPGQQSSEQSQTESEVDSETSQEESEESSEEESIEESSEEESSEEESSEEESSEEESSEEESEESEESSEEEESGETEEESSDVAPSGELVMTSVDDDYFADALFIGDSRIVGLSEYGTIRNATFYAQIGISNAGLLESGALPGVLSSGNYGKVYLCCGINNIGMGADTCFSDFLDILDLVRTYQPDAIVYVMSNAYVTPEYWSEHPDFNNDEIRSYNYMLASLDDGDRTVFLNIAGLFESDYGFLEYESTFDGIHLTVDGYETWSYYLKNHAMVEDN